ncbi:MAG: PEP-CTERM sorting domain-containing protein, partial [Phycisphaerae bacterium]|nr:PEP-CTERM sorting domain-containing protein [Phycisphaerae bacterium]
AGAGQTADFDGDGDVDLDDFVIIRENFGFTSAPQPAAPDFSATPEPATMSLLALGGLMVLRRRRRK